MNYGEHSQTNQITMESAEASQKTPSQCYKDSDFISLLSSVRQGHFDSIAQEPLPIAGDELRLSGSLSSFSHAGMKSDPASTKPNILGGFGNAPILSLPSEDSLGSLAHNKLDLLGATSMSVPNHRAAEPNPSTRSQDTMEGMDLHRASQVPVSLLHCTPSGVSGPKSTDWSEDEKNSNLAPGHVGTLQQDEFGGHRPKNPHKQPNGRQGTEEIDKWSRNSMLNAFSDLNPIKKSSIDGRKASRSPPSMQPFNERDSKQSRAVPRRFSSGSDIDVRGRVQSGFGQRCPVRSIDILSESELGTHSQSGSIPQSSGNGMSETKKLKSRGSGHQSHRNKNHGSKDAKKQRNKENGRKNGLEGG